MGNLGCHPCVGRNLGTSLEIPASAGMTEKDQLFYHYYFTIIAVIQNMELKNNLKPKVTIDITSLVDVVFLLLIFFMVTSTFLELPGMKLDLPTAKTGRGQSAKELTLFLTKTGNILLDNESISIEELPQKLKISLKDRANKSLVLKGDKDVSYGRVVKVMDIAKEVGIQKLVMATKFPMGNVHR